MRVLDFFFAARPLLHMPIWTVYLVSLHYHHQLSGELFGWRDLVIMAGISLLFAGASYLNQVYDFESDRINGKLGFLQRGLLTQSQLLTGFTVVSLVAMAVAPLFSWLTLFIFAQLLVLSLIYSVTPLRLKDRPVGGLLANAWAFGFLVSVSVMPNMTLHNVGLLGWDAPFSLFLAVGAIYALTTIPDRPGDTATGKRTLAVVLGVTGTTITAIVLLLLAALTALLSRQTVLFFVAAGAAGLVSGTLLLKTESSVRLAAKLPLLALTLAAGYWYPAYLVFVVALLIATRAYYRRRFQVSYPELA
ncbi:MAG: UbiA family prenyltransferase [candidate division Zixibacteria bacterium]|nr:UbiA family prenyltransferase [candidate division Zixibacteria bacterium]